jgi:hypothetical protein
MEGRPAVDARLVAVGDAELAVCDWGSGDPILFLQTALTADELVPLANQPALAGFRKLLYHGGATVAVVASSPPVRSPAMPMTLVCC